MSELSNKLRWLIGIRMLIVLSIAIPYWLFYLFQGRVAGEPAEAEGVGSRGTAVVQPAPSDDEPAAEPTLPSRESVDLQQRRVIFILFTAGCVQTLLYIVLLPVLRRRPKVHGYIQFCGDLLLITVLNLKLAAVASGFSILYLIVISVASVLLRRSAGLIVATLAYLLYAAMTLSPSFDSYAVLQARGGLFAPGPAEPLTGMLLAYNLVVHLLGFYAVALLTSYLARDVARVEEKLQQKQLDLTYLQVLYGDVIQSMSGGLLITDLEGRVINLNRAGREILARPEDELIGKHVTAAGIFTREEWERHTRGTQEIVVRSEVECRRGDGGSVYIGFTLTHLRDGQGAWRGYILIFQDLSDWRNLQEQLRMQDRMAALGQMAAGLAHEVGNPLAAISGSVQMLAGSLHGNQAQQKLLEITLKESRRLDRTVKEFLQFAKPRGNPAQFDVAALLAEDVQLLRNSDDVQPEHEIVARLIPESALIIADLDQVGQIFWNLTRNALQAMPDGGRLTIDGELEDGVYRMHFRDTGSGMSEEERARLFHPFKSFFDGGTGLGMAIVYRIVEEHGGKIRVESRPQHGSVITVELPVAPAEIKEEVEA